MTMEIPDEREELVGFLRTIALPGGQVDGVDDEANLFDSGSLDSLAVVQIVLYLEQTHGVDLARNGVDPDELGSVSGILKVIRRSEVS